MARKESRSRRDSTGIKLSLGALTVIQPSLQKLAAQNLPILLAYKISKIASKVQTEMSILEDLRRKLVEKHGQDYKEDDGAITIPEDSKEYTAFVEEYKVLLTKEIHLDVNTISIKEFGENFQFPAKNLADLAAFITE